MKNHTFQFQHTLRISLLAVLATLALVVGMTTLGTSPSSATGGRCTSGVVKTYNNLRGPIAWCHTFGTAPLYRTLPWTTPSEKIGKMYAGSNWVLCQSQGISNPVTYNSNGTSNLNNWWLLTQGDAPWSSLTSRAFYAANGWTWMPATHVIEGYNYQAVPGVANCGSYVF